MKSFFFIQLFVIVIFTASFIPTLGSSFINKSLIGYFQEELARYQAGTTLALLKESMALKSEAQRAVFLAEQQASMPYRLSLETVDSLTLDNHQLLALYQESLVYNPDNQFLYLILSGHKYALVLENINVRSDHVYSEAEREGMGLMTLLQRQLADKESSEWPSIIANKATLFSFDIVLGPNGEFPLTQNQQTKLDQGKLVAITQNSLIKYGSGLNYVLQLTPDRQHVIIAGPIAPTISSLINEYDLVNRSLSVILLLCLLSFWIWPTWRSSRELRVFIHQHAESGKAESLTLRFGSHFNELHHTFNQMSDSLSRQFSLNKTVIQYLSRRLDKPLLEMKQGLDKLEASVDKQITGQGILVQEKAINSIRHISSDILLFSQAQRMSDLPNIQCFDLDGWLISQQDKLREAVPLLNLIRANQRYEVLLDSQFFGQALTQILIMISQKVPDELSLSVSVHQSTGVLNICCCSDDPDLNKALTLLCDIANTQGAMPTSMMLMTESYLPLFTFARILRLQGGSLALHKSRDRKFRLEISFSHENLPAKEGEA